MYVRPAALKKVVVRCPVWLTVADISYRRLTVSSEGPLGPVRAFVPAAAVVAAEPGVDFEWDVRPEKREREAN
jgi:hypothetical protein